MNEERFEQLLADYLGDELDAGGRAAFEAELARDPLRRRRAEELRAAQAALVADVPARREAARRAAGLAAPSAATTGEDAIAFPASSDDPATDRGATRPRSRRWLRSGVWRYAATILLAFGAGYLSANLSATKTQVAGADPDGPGPVANLAARQTQAELVRNYADASRAFPHASSFTRSILALARR